MLFVNFGLENLAKFLIFLIVLALSHMFAEDEEKSYRKRLF